MIVTGGQDPGGPSVAAAIDARQHEQLLIRQLLLEGLGFRLAGGELERHGLDPSRAHHVIRARPSSKLRLGSLMTQLCEGAAQAGGRALLGLIAGDVCGMMEYLPVCSIAVPVGVSGAVLPSGLTLAFAHATRAHQTALALGRPGLSDLDSLGIYPSVLTDVEVGAGLIDTYITPIERLGPAGESILQTVEQYLRFDSALAATARSLQVHVNTVRSRLRRFEDVTGRSLKSTEVLAEIWWALSKARVLARAAGGSEVVRPVSSGGFHPQA